VCRKKIFIGLSLEMLTLFRCKLTIAMNQNVAAGIVVVVEQQQHDLWK